MSDDERWRKMTPTERERNAVIIAEALQKTFDRISEMEAKEKADKERIAELEAQVSRLRAVAKAADRVWEKADTDDEPWALRDMIDALEALQHGDLEPMEGGS